MQLTHKHTRVRSHGQSSLSKNEFITQCFDYDDDVEKTS